MSKDGPTRRQVAEFFSLLQTDDPPFQEVWESFETAFLINGLKLESNGRKYEGLTSGKIKPTISHMLLASLLAQGQAYLLTLNFDGLSRLALRKLNAQNVSLHTEAEIVQFFTATNQDHIAPVFNVRGDVFFARCSKPACPTSKNPVPLERFLDKYHSHAGPEAESALVCPVCTKNHLKLQFSFPGYREKEEQAEPVLWGLRRFIGYRTSAIVVLGLSGRWDRHLLRFLFDMAVERNIPIVDVNKVPVSKNLIDGFRRNFYPAVPITEDRIITNRGAQFLAFSEEADHFMSSLYPDRSIEE